MRDDAGTVTSCGVAIGGVAPIPLRLTAVEDLLTRLDARRRHRLGGPPRPPRTVRDPLPETGYKVPAHRGDGPRGARTPAVLTWWRRERAVDRARLGAWVLKCNPVLWDLRGLIDSGVDRMTSWAVQPGYRARLDGAR